MPVIPAAVAQPSNITQILLALEQVESGGDPMAHRPGSKFYGPLQIGPAYAEDVGIGDPRVFLGNRELSFWAVKTYMERYKARHRWIPDVMAAIHKGGPGTARAVLRGLDSGLDLNQALSAAEAGRLGNRAMPNLVEYVRRFRRELAQL